MSTPPGAVTLAKVVDGLIVYPENMARNLERWLSPSELAGAGTGAVLAIGRAGAYGAAMTSVYPSTMTTRLCWAMARLARSMP